MEDKVYIEFDLGNEEMIREAIREPLYEDFLVWLLQDMKNTLEFRSWHTFYEDEFMNITVKP